MSTLPLDYFSLGQIPVNTLVALGTKTKTSRHRSLASGCISISGKSEVAIENGRAIRIILHRPATDGASHPLRDGDGVNILNVCGKNTEAHSLEADVDGSLVWSSAGSLRETPTWRVFASPHGVATTRTELEMMQSVYLVHADKIVSALPDALQFSLAQTYLPETALKPVPFFFTTPAYLPHERIPKFVTHWFPNYQLNNERWLTAWNQSSAMHTDLKLKWNKEALEQLAIHSDAAGLLSASEGSEVLKSKPWTRGAAMARAELHMGAQANVHSWKRHQIGKM